ncbi:unnamed protein product [Peronospora belbahrii]|uniref:Uncharacterized protein n=1 Tax=Peronospora belbahrii TaxID=622444 RepID=A0ABN8CVR8_9STRA|nr:unnamed protein product [Peronospora belbahrii]
MQFIKGCIIAAVLFVSSVSARNLQDADFENTPLGEEGFSVDQVNFAANDPKEEDCACACIGVLGAVYMKRRKEEEKMPGEIFTIDDKNSVL